MRRLVLTNRSARPREIEVTSYAEVVLAPLGADMAHPAFQKLFVETEFVRTAAKADTAEIALVPISPSASEAF